MRITPTLLFASIVACITTSAMAQEALPEEALPEETLPKEVLPEPEQGSAELPPAAVVVVQPVAVHIDEVPKPHVPPPPPPAPGDEKGTYTHDGFYLRMGIGPGALVLANVGKSTSDANLSTAGLGIDFGMGGTISHGMVIGGRLVGVGGNSLRLNSEDESTKVPGSMNFSSVQLFLDWYIDPEAGLHVEGALGPASLSYQASEDSDEDDDEVIDGFGGAIGIGWEGWVGEQWSIGAVLRVNWATFSGAVSPASSLGVLHSQASSEGSGRLIAIAPMLVFSATYH